MKSSTGEEIEEEHISCNYCGNDDYIVVYEKIDVPLEVPLIDKFSAAKGVLSTDQIVRCKHCDLVYTNPRINGKIIVDSCSQGDDEVYVSQGAGRKETFQEGWNWVEKVTGKAVLESGQKKKILDIGCAAGFFLTIAREKGLEAHGVEPNAWLAEYGRKNSDLKHVTTGTLEEGKFADDFFDYATMWDVLEHVPDPMATLHEVHRVLKKGGHLIVSYPDFGSIFAKIFKRKWWFLLSHHIFYFTPQTLEKMLKKEGFEIVTDKMHWQKLKLVYMLDMFAKLNKNPLIRAPFSFASAVLKAVGLKNMQVRYYASQRDVIARKL